MVVGITITNLLRNHIPKLEMVYKGVTKKDPVNLPINPYELDKHFPTQEAGKELNEFDENVPAYQDNVDYLGEFKEDEIDFDVYQLLFVDASYEIFGSSDEATPGLILELCKKIGESKHRVVLTNMESPRSKCATLYFLSKNNFDLKELYFPSSREEMWKHVDVLITDDPKILELKPAGKKSIKIENDFNKSVDSDLSLSNINKLIDDFDITIDNLVSQPIINKLETKQTSWVLPSVIKFQK